MSNKDYDRRATEAKEILKDAVKDGREFIVVVEHEDGQRLRITAAASTNTMLNVGIDLLKNT